MINPQLAKPLYEQIKDYLLNCIDQGIYPADTRLPSERDLAEQFGVSRLTVKKAISDLLQSGHVYVQIGKGTYVSRAKIDQSLDALTSFSEDVGKRRQRPSSRVLEAREIPASVDEARTLRIPAGAPLFLLRRVRLADDVPMAIESSRVVAALCPGLLDGRDFGATSLYHVLRAEYSIRLTYAEQSIEARLASIEEAHLLAVEVRAPILGISRVTYTDTDVPVEFALSAYCGTRYKFQAILRRV
jgi:GntR family transcriptional regulator